MNNSGFHELAKKLHNLPMRDCMISKTLFHSPKKTAYVNLLKIHLLLIKLILVREISSWIMKAFR
jgi:hypothetical protein